MNVNCNKNKNGTRLTNSIWVVNPITIVAIVSSFYVLLNSPDITGTGAYFMLPLAFAFCSFFFSDVIRYHRGAWGLKVFYVVALFRYVFLPVLTCLAGAFSNSTFSPAAYRYAIFISCIELIVSTLIIKASYKREFLRVEKKWRNINETHDVLGIGGLVIIFSSIALIYIRGIDKLLISMRFGVISEKLDESAHYSYDIWLAQLLKAFFVIIVVSFFAKRNEKRESVWNIVLPLLISGLCCLLNFGNNRMMIVYYTLTSIMLLFSAFPKRKKIILATLVPISLAVIISFTMVKQFGIDATAEQQTTVGIESWASTLSAYVCGIENIAHSFEMYALNGNQMSLFTIFSDIVQNTKILGLPGLNKIQTMFSEIPTSVELATTGTEMVSVAGQTLFYGGYVFGWLLDVLAHIVVIRLLIKFDVRAKLASNEGNRYIYTWLSVLFGMTMCYCLETLYANVTYIPFFLLIVLQFNRRFHLKGQI